MKTLDEFLKVRNKPAPRAGETRRTQQKQRKKLYGKELPEGWDVVRLSDILTLVKRETKVLEDAEYRILGVKWYCNGIFEKGRFKGTDIKAKKLYKVHTGDFIYNKLFAWKGSFALVSEEFDGAYVSNEFPTFRVKDESILDKEYLLFYVSQPPIWEYLGSLSSGTSSVSRLRLKPKVFLELQIPLPPIEEQRKIVHVLKTVQKAIEHQGQIIETTKELKKVLMKRLFTKGLDPNQPTKMTEIGEIPEHWELHKLGELGELKYGYTATATNHNTGVKFLRITDIQEDGRILWEDVPYCQINPKEYLKYRLKRGDIVFARIGATSGKTAFIESEITSVFASYLIRFRVTSPKLLPRFLFYFTQSEIYWSKVIQEREDKLKKGINATMLSSLLIPVPPTLEEQQKIASILLTVDKKIELAQKKKNALEELFSTLRYKLMTGQIRVHKLEIPRESDS